MGEKTATTIRFGDEVNDALAQVSNLLHRTKTSIVREAVMTYLDQQTRELEEELRVTRMRLNAYREGKEDPGFEKAIDAFATAEIEQSDDDPYEGAIEIEEPAPLTSDIRKMIRYSDGR